MCMGQLFSTVRSDEENKLFQYSIMGYLAGIHTRGKGIDLIDLLT